MIISSAREPIHQASAGNISIFAKLRFLSTISCFLVVIIHSVSNFNIGGPWIRDAVYDGICRIAVPFFFFLSGFFLGNHIEERGWYKREVVKRLHSLLIPYFIWISLYILLPIGNHASHSEEVQGIALNGLSSIAEAYGFNPFSWPILVPLWYVRALFLLVALSPVLVWAMRKLDTSAGTRWMCLALFLLYGSIGPYEGMDSRWAFFFRKFLALQGLFYFTCGMAYRTRRICLDLSRWQSFACLSIGLGLMVAKVLLQRDDCGLYLYCGWLSVFLLVLAIFNIAPSIGLPNWLSSNTFPVYVIHMFWIRIFCALLDHFGLLPPHMKGWILLPMATGIFMISIATSYLLKNSPWSAILFGGR